MAKTGTQRKAEHDERKAQGIVAPHVPFHRQDTTDTLIEAGLLPEWDAENMDAVVKALAKAIQLMNERHGG